MSTLLTHVMNGVKYSYVPMDTYSEIETHMPILIFIESYYAHAREKKICR